MHMPPEIVKPLLDAPFALILAFHRAGAPNLCVHTVIWPMMMEGFVVMFSGKSFLQESEKDGHRTMNVSIELFTRLI